MREELDGGFSKGWGYHFRPSEEYVIEGTGIVPKGSELGDGTLVADITSWKRISTAEEE